MATQLTLGSLFTGIGGFDLAAERAGLETRWQVENDPFANRVLVKHWPVVPRYGDIEGVSGAELEPVDVISAGWPCVDLSIAGKRKGIYAAQSGLFFDLVRIVREMRDATEGRYPTCIVLENVPGLLNSHRGRDMAVVLGALAELRPVEIAWRILDARHFRIAQRRRRVFIVLDFGGECAAQILFESEGGSRDIATSEAEGTDVAYCLAASVRGTGDGHGQGWNSNYIVEEVAGTLGGGSGKRGWCSDVERMTFLPVAVSDAVFLHNNKGRPAGRKSQHTDMVSIKEIVPTLTTDGHMQSSVAYALCGHAAKGGDPTMDSYVLTAGFNPQMGGDIRLQYQTDSSPTLQVGQHAAVLRVKGALGVSMAVRRLTPL